MEFNHEKARRAATDEGVSPRPDHEWATLACRSSTRELWEESGPTIANVGACYIEIRSERDALLSERQELRAALERVVSRLQAHTFDNPDATATVVLGGARALLARMEGATDGQ